MDSTMKRHRTIRHPRVYRAVCSGSHIMLFCNSKFLPLIRDFHRIRRYSLGAASLAHLYRLLFHAWRNIYKEMDDPLILLFVWVLERMPWIALVPRGELLVGDVPIRQH
ncbi:hypothetical protein Ahy_A04g020371 [Arachis hypogaea]|uniref:Aminotransferase-like plant mobile domain-containing protein n=1 Tax=Arachis hypogaea TaxID=3818 RepID=A0A445DHM4_ARAHY|nr:hypothetical protein Ahy_A04g020371 [Arachis hypogaea]